MAKRTPAHKNDPTTSDEKIREVARQSLPVSFDDLVGGLLQVDPTKLPPRAKKKAVAKKKATRKAVKRTAKKKARA